MKKLFTICIILLTAKMLAQPCTFTVNPQGSTYSITCANPTVNLQAATDYTGAAMSYTWVKPTFTSNANPVALTSTGNYTVIASAAGCSATTQTFAVVMNTTAPTNSVQPVSQVITCNAAAPITFTGTVINPTSNVQHDWYSPLNPLPGGVPISTSNNTISVLAGIIPPGVYTLQTTNLLNGCLTLKTVTVTSLDAWPTFGVNSSTNFSVGCMPLNQTTISIINPVSTQTPPSTCSYTFLPPNFGGTLAAGPFGANSSTITGFPGTWTVIVYDNSNGCKTSLWVPITQNTVAPDVSASMITQTLTCNNPTVLATGSSTTPNTVISWIKPVAPPSVPSNTIVIGPGTGPNSSTTSLTYANYTVIVTNAVNACISTSVVVINQNFHPPISSPAIAFAPTIICNSSTVVLTTGNSTTTSGAPGSFPIPFLWEGPPPQATVTGASSYSCMVAGVYSLTIKDNYNGCTKMGTITVLDGSPAFNLSGISPSSSVSCDGTVVINPQAANGYTVSVNTGSLNGNNITDLCYGQLIVCLTYTATGCKKCDTLLINATTGMKNINADDPFVLYPNPTSSTLFIKNTGQKSGAIKIFNVEGKEIESLILDGSAGSTITTIENLKAGIYFAQINIGGIIYRKKVVVLN